MEGKKMPTIAISGGFDPIHGGHIDLIDEASIYGDVVVILNSDDWLTRKKGKPFMKWEHRAKVMRSIKGILNVIPVDDSDGTVCSALRQLKPDYFANGGDRTNENTPELKICADYGIKPLFGIGGDKTGSSSALIRGAMQFHDW
jgi:D-beta-D-heptose 7-phosphate kinase/D-beta-D-heptose 1-phosphate adenosyltransferase